jgi:multiple sugar transport system substrate-binding protein
VVRPIGPRALVVRHRASRRPWWGIGIVLVTAAVVSLPIAVSAVTRSAGQESVEVETPVELSLFWWGGSERAIITEKALNLYTSRHPKVTFAKQQQAFTGYYDRLIKQAAAGNQPDLFQVDDNGLNDLVQRGLVLDLSNYVKSGKLNVSHLPRSLVDYGVIDGKTVAIAAAENTPAMVYDKTVIKKLDMPEPETGWTWQHLVDWAKQLTFKSGGKTYGTMDPSGDYKALWLWLRQQGKEFYNGQQIGFTSSDLRKWFEIWAEARKSSAAPTAEIIQPANSTDVAKQLVITKQAATSFVWSNQLAEMQKGTQNELGMVAYPGDPKGQWARASQYWVGAQSTKHAKLVADVINFLVNDPEAAKILGTERGLPPNLENRKVISDTLTPQMQATVTFETSLAQQFGKAPPVPPKGHSDIRSVLVAAAESVQSGKAPADKAADQFLAKAATILSGKPAGT